MQQPRPPLDLKLAGTASFLPALLAHIRATHNLNIASSPNPGLQPLPLDNVIFQSILLCLIGQQKHLVLRTPEEDVGLAVKLVLWTLSNVFDLEVHKVKVKPSSRAPASGRNGRLSSTAKAEAQFRNEAGAAERFLKSLFVPSVSPRPEENEYTQLNPSGGPEEDNPSTSLPTPKPQRHHEYTRSRSFPQNLNLSGAGSTSITPSTSTSASTGSTIIRPRPTYAYRPSLPHAYTYPVNATPSSGSFDAATPTTASTATPIGPIPPAIGRRTPTPRLPHAYTDPLPLPHPYTPKSRHAKTKSKGSSHSRHRHSKSRSQSSVWYDAEEEGEGAGEGGVDWRAEDMHLPQALVLSGLEHANEGAQRAFGRVLSDRKVVLPVRGEQEERTWEVPNDFIVVYVCPWNARQRPAVHTSLLDKFAMSTNVFIPQNIRHDFRLLQFSSSSSFPPGSTPGYPFPKGLGQPHHHSHLHTHTHHNGGHSHSNPGSPSPAHPVALPPTHTPPVRTTALPSHGHGYPYGHSSTSSGSFSPSASPPLLGHASWRPVSASGYGSSSAYGNGYPNLNGSGGYERQSYAYTQSYTHPYPSPTDRDSHTSPFFSALPSPSALAPVSPSSPAQTAVPPAPLLPPGLLASLRILATDHTYISPSLSLYLADLFSATRHHPRLDGMLLGARAMRDAEVLVRAGKVVGIGGGEAATAVQLGVGNPPDISKMRTKTKEADYSDEEDKEDCDEEDETGEGDGGAYGYTSTGESSKSDVHQLIHNATYNPVPLRSPLSPRSPYVHPSTGPGPNRSTLEPGPDAAPASTVPNLNSFPILDVSEVDIARIVPRVVSHRVRVRAGPRDEVLSGVLFGATFDGEGIDGWEVGGGEKGMEAGDADADADAGEGQGQGGQEDRETVKSVLVQILSEV
ncbi:unnamed protein product [Cyclocybe aegerita]|uniref:Uncharacterized protein n=1 Tax=Cyclocybe aegerita TaxID=1973307 RepID=A0A8S0VQP2_CYCAE|nr:unnamed protein product [Cyclocybe aegerita]